MQTVLFAAVVLTLFSKAPQAAAMAKMPSGYDNDLPRAQVAKLEGWGQRSAAAHANAWEALLVHAIGVLAVLASGVDSSLAP
ncbi:MAG: putative MAPEG superfamily protein, partial [Flavobacteriales bacterium]